MLDPWPLPWDAKYKLNSDVKTANLLAGQSKRNQRDEPELTGEDSIRNWRERVGGEADALVMLIVFWHDSFDFGYDIFLLYF